MNTPACRSIKTVFASVAGILLLAACTSTPTKPAGAEAVRSKLTQLQSDPQLASRAPVAIKDAELAVRAAEESRDDHALEQHLVLMADRKVEIARARAQARLSQDQRKALGDQRQSARLESRTREAEQAHDEARAASAAAADARRQASSARADADFARLQAESARLETEAAQQQSDDLQRQIAELNARPTDRGLVVTLGDVLFASGQSGLKGASASNLNRLAAFLNRYPERTVLIEGHTDSVGSASANDALSQRRADAVKTYLIGQGVDPGRLAASGKGKGAPVASNDSAAGRQQNRRVEVIISNSLTSSR
jgi:outer membrane protein OmpA-like peptidoglycan-associated protein